MGISLALTGRVDSGPLAPLPHRLQNNGVRCKRPACPANSWPPEYFTYLCIRRIQRSLPKKKRLAVRRSSCPGSRGQSPNLTVLIRHSFMLSLLSVGLVTRPHEFFGVYFHNPCKYTADGGRAAKIAVYLVKPVGRPFLYVPRIENKIG